jgi:hypothetical protein
MAFIGVVMLPKAMYGLARMNRFIMLDANRVG